MQKMLLRYEENKNVNFMLIVKYLVSCNIASLEAGRSMYLRFKSGEDVLFVVPDQAVVDFRSYLGSLNCRYD